MNKQLLFRIIPFTTVAVLAVIGIFFNLKLLVIIDMVIILGLLFLLNRKK